MTRCPACDSSHLSSSYMGHGHFATLHYAYLECRRCGTAFVDPMPGADILEEMYSPAYASAHYGAELLGDSSSAEADHELELALGLIARESRGGRVLDVGCGAGRLLRMASSRGLPIEGYEPVAASAQRTAEITGVPVHAGSLATAPGPYQVVHVADVLEHTPRPFEVLLQMQRLLAPTGRLVARGPLEAQPTLFRRVVRWQRLVRSRLGRVAAVTMPPWHLILYSLRGWRAMLARAGLRTLEEHRHEFHWPGPETFEPRPIWLVKHASVLASRSRLGQRLLLCDRAVSLLAARDSAAT